MRRFDCPDVFVMALSKPLEGDLEQTLCTDLERHIDTCAGRRGMCDSLKRALAICGHLPARPVTDGIKEAVRKAVRDALAVTRKQLVQD